MPLYLDLIWGYEELMQMALRRALPVFALIIVVIAIAVTVIIRTVRKKRKEKKDEEVPY